MNYYDTYFQTKQRYINFTVTNSKLRNFAKVGIHNEYTERKRREEHIKHKIERANRMQIGGECATSTTERNNPHMPDTYHELKNGEIITVEPNIEYRVTDFSGAGTYGKVWYVEKTGGGTYALKVIKSRFNNVIEREIDILTSLKGAKNIIQMHDCMKLTCGFTFHYCIVTDVLGNELLEWIKRYNYCGLPIIMVQKIARQSLEALVSLQEREIIHADIKPENIMLSYKTKIRTNLGGKEICDKKTNTGKFYVDDINVYDNIETVVIDFGNAKRLHEIAPRNYFPTREYVPPEYILGMKTDYGCDVFSLACTIFELVTGDFLFDIRAYINAYIRKYTQDNQEDPSRREINEYERERHIKLMVSTVTHDGIVPKELREHTRSMQTLQKQIPIWNIEHKLIQEYGMNDEDANLISDFLTPMLNLDYTKRISAKDALGLDWMKKQYNIKDFLPKPEPMSELTAVSHHQSPEPTAAAFHQP
jgi:serine/threonine protein kinase